MMGSMLVYVRVLRLLLACYYPATAHDNVVVAATHASICQHMVVAVVAATMPVCAIALVLAATVTMLQQHMIPHKSSICQHIVVVSATVLQQHIIPH